MRVLVLVALFATLTGCAASKQEVVARLGDQFTGQNVDALLVKLGPPTKTFKMSSGDTLYSWQLANQTLEETRFDHARSGPRFNRTELRYCEVNAVVSKDNIVTQLNTDDTNAGRGIVGTLGGSVCAHRLGIRHQG
ncbi:MAG: hypothetical protein ACRECL_02570 [Bradyrhizobium sp.]